MLPALHGLTPAPLAGMTPSKPVTAQLLETETPEVRSRESLEPLRIRL